MIDTHCHLNFKAFENEWLEVADRAVAAGIEKMIVVGADFDTSEKAVWLANQHRAIYAAVGIHPHHAREFSISNPPAGRAGFQFSINDLIFKLRELTDNPKVVAIGEIGLDYHVPKVSKYPEELLPLTEELKTRQKELFKAQLQLATELNKPVILHSRECGEEVLVQITNFKSQKTKDIRGVFHCFGGSKKYMARILAAGFYIGFDGDITYVPDRLGVAAAVPLDKLLLETDSPYLAPIPVRGEQNEPKNVALIAQAQAQIRGITVEEVGRVTSENAQTLFNI